MDLSQHGLPGIGRASSHDPLLSYRTIVSLDPIDDADSMGETRHVAIGFETYDGTIHDYRGAVTFDRFAGSASYRFHIRGVRAERNDDGTMPNDCALDGPIESMELRLTSRFEWYTKFQKIRGNETSGRIIRMRFLRSKDEQHGDAIRQIDIIVLKTEFEDKGKLLELAVEQAASLVDANIAERKFNDEVVKQTVAKQEALARKHQRNTTGSK
ncbi:hypothetical protein SEMRO_1999_G310140.1 [Seminavis robusta]|uniref:Uncharacterized protein n=1 Tax=Seminavis robusta TaxID=568900 RepID=A0A9N8EUL7_9STRA|nr:hypothetical protein SEMRO_1999_G310140.1 [Seminavis robusta]|eukprot:Sro1999_g310140.1 n/a (213) ;mRNA; r:4541-5179